MKAWKTLMAFVLLAFLPSFAVAGETCYGQQTVLMDHVSWNAGIATRQCMYRNEVIDYLDYKIHQGAFTDG